MHHVGAVTMYGVCDGHGPFGHLVSFRLVQTIPYFLTNSEHFGKNWEEALKEAFAKAQEDLEEFCTLDFELEDCLGWCSAGTKAWIRLEMGAFEVRFGPR